MENHTVQVFFREPFHPYCLAFNNLTLLSEWFHLRLSVRGYGGTSWNHLVGQFKFVTSMSNSSSNLRVSFWGGHALVYNEDHHFILKD